MITIQHLLGGSLGGIINSKIKDAIMILYSVEWYSRATVFPILDPRIRNHISQEQHYFVVSPLVLVLGQEEGKILT